MDIMGVRSLPGFVPSSPLGISRPLGSYFLFSVETRRTLIQLIVPPAAFYSLAHMLFPLKMPSTVFGFFPIPPAHHVFLRTISPRRAMGMSVHSHGY